GQIVGSGNADNAGLFADAEAELQHGRTEDRIEQDRQDGDHQDGSPITKLIAHLSEEDETDNGPAHATPRNPRLSVSGSGLRARSLREKFTILGTALLLGPEGSVKSVAPGQAQLYAWLRGNH